MASDLSLQTAPATRGRRRGTLLVLAVVVVILAACGVLWLFAKPSPASFRFSKMHATYGAGTFSQTVTIGGGGRDERITGVSVSGTGIGVVGPVVFSAPGLAPRDAKNGVGFPAHSQLRIEVHFRVTNCNDPHLSLGPIPLQITVKRQLFSETDTVVDDGQDFPDAGKACGFYH